LERVCVETDYLVKWMGQKINEKKMMNIKELLPKTDE